MKRLALVVGVIVILLFAFSTNADAGLVSWWKFEEDSGTLYDSADSNNGTYNGTLFQETGVGGSHALGFDGTDDFVDCGTGSNLNIADAITIEAWIKPLSASGTQGIVGRHTAGNNAGGTLRLFGNQVHVLINIGGSYSLFNTASEVTGNNWFYIAYTYNGSIEKIYVNSGIAKVSRNNSGSIYTPVPHNYIGATYGVNKDLFKGVIDEVRIWNHALTDDEIDWNSKHPGQLIPEPSALLLMGTGLLGILVFGWKSKD